MGSNPHAHNPAERKASELFLMFGREGEGERERGTDGEREREGGELCCRTSLGKLKSNGGAFTTYA